VVLYGGAHDLEVVGESFYQHALAHDWLSHQPAGSAGHLPFSIVVTRPDSLLVPVLGGTGAGLIGQSLGMQPSAA
jgi:hypothetical protein